MEFPKKPNMFLFNQRLLPYTLTILPSPTPHFCPSCGVPSDIYKYFQGQLQGQNPILNPRPSLPRFPSLSIPQPIIQPPPKDSIQTKIEDIPAIEALAVKEPIPVEEPKPKAILPLTKKIMKIPVKAVAKTDLSALKKKKTFWKQEEDAQVLSLLAKMGPKWTKIGRLIGGRTGKQVRDRYLYTLSPDINKDKWTEKEDQTLLSLYDKFGNKWRQIVPYLPGRTENQIKNRFNSKRKEANAQLGATEGPQISPTADTTSPVLKEEVKIEFDIGEEK